MALLTAQASGKIIQPDANGYPQAVDRPASPSPTIDEVYSAKVAEIRDGADAFMDAAMATRAEYGNTELATWNQQYSEAEEYMQGSRDVPLLTTIAAFRGQDVADLVTAIIRNRAAWATLSGAIVGQRLAYQDTIDTALAAGDGAAILAVTPVYTLPTQE